MENLIFMLSPYSARRYLVNTITGDFINVITHYT